MLKDFFQDIYIPLGLALFRFHFLNRRGKALLLERVLVRIPAAAREAGRAGGRDSSLPLSVPYNSTACERGNLTGSEGKGQHRLKEHSSDTYTSLGRVLLEII